MNDSKLLSRDSSTISLKQPVGSSMVIANASGLSETRQLPRRGHRTGVNYASQTFSNPISKRERDKLSTLNIDTQDKYLDKFNRNSIVIAESARVADTNKNHLYLQRDQSLKRLSMLNMTRQLLQSPIHSASGKNMALPSDGDADKNRAKYMTIAEGPRNTLAQHPHSLA